MIILFTRSLMTEESVSVFLTKPFPKLSIMVHRVFNHNLNTTIWITYQLVCQCGAYTRNTNNRFHVCFSSKLKGLVYQKFKIGCECLGKLDDAKASLSRNPLWCGFLWKHYSTLGWTQGVFIAFAILELY